MAELVNWLEAGGAALGGIGAAAAAITAVVLWRKDRSREGRQAIKARSESLRNLVAGLSAEIRSASSVADTRRHAIGRTLAGVQEALERGAQVKISGPLAEGEMTLTDGVIYASVADRLGLFTPAIIERIVSFFTHAREIERVSRMSPNVLHGYETVYSMLPRFRMNAAVLLRLLEKYRDSDFDASADLKLSLEEMRQFANETGYPLDEVLRERGLIVVDKTT